MAPHFPTFPRAKKKRKKFTPSTEDFLTTFRFTRNLFQQKRKIHFQNDQF